MISPLMALVTAATAELQGFAEALRAGGWPTDVIVTRVDDPPLLQVALRVQVPLPPVPVEADGG